MKIYILIITLFLLPYLYGCSSEEEQDSKPNIVFILADDLGCGDAQFLNPKLSKIRTPNLDKLAKEGMSFTGAHSSSSVCTPTCYGILTCCYNWRSRLQRGVSYSHIPLIDKDRLTFPSMLKQLGYAMACIGKWHLGGFEWQKHEWQIDYSLPVTVDPRIHGFDRYFGVPIPGRPPHCFIENDLVTVLPTTRSTKIIGAKIPDNAAEDSFSILSLLRGSTKPIRESLVHHSINGNFAIREGKWKLNLCPGSGGWDYPTNDEPVEEGLPSIQLYVMSVDLKESNNLQAEHPDVVKHLTKLLKKIVDDGRSTPGPLQKNDALVDIYKVKKL